MEREENELVSARRRWIKSKSGKFLTQIEGYLNMTFIGQIACWRYYDMPDNMPGDWYYLYDRGQIIVFNGRNCSFREYLSVTEQAHIEYSIHNYYIETDELIMSDYNTLNLTKEEKNDIINIEEKIDVEIEVPESKSFTYDTLDFDNFLKENTITL